MSLSGLADRLAALPVLASPFRIFYLLGAAYAPALAVGGVLAFAGVVDLGATGGPVLWHGHEMLFGFGGAIAVGTVLTALPSWAGMVELRGLPLGALALSWVVGRVIFWGAPWLPWRLLAALDLLPWVALTIGLARPLWRLPNRLYRLLLPIFAALLAADVAYLDAAAAADAISADRALRAATWALMVLYALKAGVLTPIFTGNALRELGRGDQATFRMALESIALALLLAVALADLWPAPAAVSGALALACTAVHGLRLVRWQGWRVIDQPLLPAMHASYVWLLLALGLQAATQFGAPLPPAAWLHAFTVGALGLMMLSLMTRVSLRHTGRPLRSPRIMRVAAWVMAAAAVLRLGAAANRVGADGITGSMLLWAGCFAAYLWRFAGIILSPSLPRDAAGR